MTDTYSERLLFMEERAEFGYRGGGASIGPRSSALSREELRTSSVAESALPWHELPVGESDRLLVINDGDGVFATSRRRNDFTLWGSFGTKKYSLDSDEDRVVCVINGDLASTKIFFSTKQGRVGSCVLGKGISWFSESHNDAVYALARMTKGVFSGSDDRTLRCWDQKGKCLVTFPENREQAHAGFVRGVQVVREDKEKIRLISYCSMGEIKFWALSPDSWKANCLFTSSKHKSTISGLVKTSTSHWVSAGADRLACVWKLHPKPAFVRSITTEGRQSAVTFIPSANRIAVGCTDGTVILWNPNLSSAEHRFQHGERVTALASLEGGLFASAGGHSVRLWSVDKNTPLTEVKTETLFTQLSVITPEIFLAVGGGTVQAYSYGENDPERKSVSFVAQFVLRAASTVTQETYVTRSSVKKKLSSFQSASSSSNRIGIRATKTPNLDPYSLSSSRKRKEKRKAVSTSFREASTAVTENKRARKKEKPIQPAETGFTMQLPTRKPDKK